MRLSNGYTDVLSSVNADIDGGVIISNLLRMSRGKPFTAETLRTQRKNKNSVLSAPLR
jgi:hypothetical protein